MAPGATPRVAAAIATHDSRDELEACLDAGAEQWAFAVVVDDGSSDGTAEMLARRHPEVEVVRGDGTLWWTGGTNLAVQHCLARGCDFVLLLNPDVVLTGGCVQELLRVAGDGTIAAALVVSRTSPDRVAWGGSVWGRLPGLPVYTSRYRYKAGTPVRSVPAAPYDTDEVHGRAVLVPAALFGRLGLFDAERFPHYGADSDFSLRARAAGVAMRIVPSAIAQLETRHSGMAREAHVGWTDRAGALWRYMTEQKHGDALRVWWRLLDRHVPPYARVPTYAFVLALNTWRRLRRPRAANREGGE